MTKENIEFNKNVAVIRKKIHPLYLTLMKKVEPMKIEVINPEMVKRLENEYFLKNIPVSFCANHTNVHDIPLAARVVKQHFYVMIAKEGLTPIQKLAFLINGPIFIKRDNKESRKKAQRKFTLAQKNGFSTLIYPEAAWNVEPNKFMNKIYNGVIKASKETKTDIIPLAFEYEDDICYVKIGEPFIVCEDKDSRIQSDELRDIMCTLRYDILEEKTNFYPEKRILKEIESLADNWENLPITKMKRLLKLYEELKSLRQKLKEEFEQKVEENWKNCPGLDKNFEASCIYKDDSSPDEVFEHLNYLEKNPKAAFLFEPNITGYRK